MSQFYWDLRDDVKDLLLSFSHPQTFKEAISQAMKCYNRLFQHRQDQRSRQHTSRYGTIMPTRSINSYSEPEDIHIDVVCVKSLVQKRKNDIQKKDYVGIMEKKGTRLETISRNRNDIVSRPEAR